MPRIKRHARDSLQKLFKENQFVLVLKHILWNKACLLHDESLRHEDDTVRQYEIYKAVVCPHHVCKYLSLASGVAGRKKTYTHKPICAPLIVMNFGIYYHMHKISYQWNAISKRQDGSWNGRQILVQIVAFWVMETYLVYCVHKYITSL